MLFVNFPGIAIGTYFAFYGAATNMLVKHTNMASAQVAFVAGAVAAAGGSVVKVIKATNLPWTDMPTGNERRFRLIQQRDV